MKIKYIVDSTFYLDDEFVNENQITVIPLNIIVNGNTYKDSIDITLEEVVEYVDKGIKVSTSQPAPILFEEAFNKAKDDGYTDIVCFTMSSTLSGTYQSAKLAASEITGIKIHLVDTLSTSVGAEICARVIIEKINNGLPLEEVESHVNFMKKNQVILMSMENLNAIKTSGRLSKIKATIGNLLRVKPIIEYIDGKVNIMTKFKTDSAIVDFITDFINRSIKGVKGKLYIFLGHVRAYERVKKIEEKLKEKFIDAVVKLTDGLSSVIAINLGYGGLGVAWTVVPE